MYRNIIVAIFLSIIAFGNAKGNGEQDPVYQALRTATQTYTTFMAELGNAETELDATLMEKIFAPTVRKLAMQTPEGEDIILADGLESLKAQLLAAKQFTGGSWTIIPSKRPMTIDPYQWSSTIRFAFKGPNIDMPYTSTVQLYFGKPSDMSMLDDLKLYEIVETFAQPKDILG